MSSASLDKMNRPTAVPVARAADASHHSTLQYEASVIHPVEEIQRSAKSNEVKTKRQLQAITYGAAMPMRLQMQEEILSQFHRLPGLQSSYLGLAALSGRDEKFDVEDYMGRPEDSPYEPETGAHEIMEKRLGIETKRPL